MRSVVGENVALADQEVIHRHPGTTFTNAVAPLSPAVQNAVG
jgi:hypothetical protein